MTSEIMMPCSVQYFFKVCPKCAVKIFQPILMQINLCEVLIL